MDRIVGPVFVAPESEEHIIAGIEQITGFQDSSLLPGVCSNQPISLGDFRDLVREKLVEINRLQETVELEGLIFQQRAFV